MPNHDSIDGKLNNILQEQIAIKLLLNRVLSKLEAISSNDIRHMSVELTDDNFLSKFPINDAEQFLFIESCILNEFGFVSKLVYYTTFE